MNGVIARKGVPVLIPDEVRAIPPKFKKINLFPEKPKSQDEAPLYRNLRREQSLGTAPLAANKEFKIYRPALTSLYEAPRGTPLSERDLMLRYAVAAHRNNFAFEYPSAIRIAPFDPRFKNILEAHKMSSATGKGIETFFELGGSMLGLVGVPLASFAGRRIGQFLSGSYVASISKLERLFSISELVKPIKPSKTNYSITPKMREAVKKQVGSFRVSPSFSSALKHQTTYGASPYSRVLLQRIDPQHLRNLDAANQRIVALASRRALH